MMINNIPKFYSGLHELAAYWQGKEKMPRSVLLQKYEAIYIPIPKVACTSLLIICAELLELVNPINPTMHTDVHSRYFPSARPLRKSKFARKKFYKRNYDRHFKFTFARNPWDRLVSCYENKINNPSYHWLKRQAIANTIKFDEGMSFETFANIVCKIPDKHAEKHFRSQYTFITDEEGQLMVDFIGKFEFLEQDMSHIFNRLGVTRKQIPHAMKSSTSSYRNYYSEELKNRVGERYSKDIDIFGYEF